MNNYRPPVNGYYNGNRGRIRIICPECDKRGLVRMAGRRFPRLSNILYRDAVCRACGHNMCLTNDEVLDYVLIEHHRPNRFDGGSQPIITNNPQIHDLKRAGKDDRGAYLQNYMGIDFAQFKIVMFGKNQERVFLYTT